MWTDRFDGDQTSEANQQAAALAFFCGVVCVRVCVYVCCVLLQSFPLLGFGFNSAIAAIKTGFSLAFRADQN